MASPLSRSDGRDHLDTVSRQVGDWTITARWFQDSDSEGPAELVLYLPREAGDVSRQRGLTTGVMRELESKLTGMVREHHAMLAEAGDQAAFELGTAELAALSPRTAEDYYPRLLELYALAKRVHPSVPVVALADALGIPKGTLTTRLHVAKRKAGADG